MSMLVLIPIGVAIILYILFNLWHRGWGKPMSVEEIDEMIVTLKKAAGIENEPDNEFILKLREIAKSDDGKEFLMVNLIKFTNKDPKSEAMAANNRYSKHIVPILFKYGSYPMFVSKVVGRFLFTETTEEWDQVAMVRYRSCRDFLKVATQGAKNDIGRDKWTSIEKTHVFPVKSILRSGSLRIGVFVFLTLIVLILAVFM
jgi:hypothetical protein